MSFMPFCSHFYCNRLFNVFWIVKVRQVLIWLVVSKVLCFLFAHSMACHSIACGHLEIMTGIWRAGMTEICPTALTLVSPRSRFQRCRIRHYFTLIFMEDFLSNTFSIPIFIFFGFLWFKMHFIAFFISFRIHFES